MKTELLRVKNKKLVLQVFHNHLRYKKDLKSFENRKIQSAWKESIISKSGYLYKDRLILPKVKDSSNLLNCNLIIINDYNSEAMINENSHEYDFFNIGKKQIKSNIFQLKMEEDKVTLHLLYNLFEIGEPKRDNFKLCNLEFNTPVEIKINGKLDHTMSRGKERTYYEQCYIFNLVGEVNEFEFQEKTNIRTEKTIPSSRKIIDLMKVLY